jgi:hypothetical protein
MDEQKKQKIATAIVSEIERALESSSITQDTAENAGADFYDLLEECKDEDSFYEGFVRYLQRYPFMNDAGEYYGAIGSQEKDGEQINEVLKNIKNMS